MKKLRLNSQVRKACQGSSRGFSMIEIVIAIALIGVIAVAVLSALATASMALIIADARATAKSLARSQMEYVKSFNYDKDNNPPQYTIDPDLNTPTYSIETTAEYFDADGDGTIEVDVTTTEVREDDEGIQKITVTVKHGGVTVITLEGYKVDR